MRHRPTSELFPSGNFKAPFLKQRGRGVGQGNRPICPGCGAYIISALRPGGKGLRTFQCLDCDRPDPLTSETATGWLKGELQPPK
jgi:hypothetical protein